MGRIGQFSAAEDGGIAELAYRPGFTASIGMDLLDFAELRRRGRDRGLGELEGGAPHRAAFPQLLLVREGELRLTVDFAEQRLRPGEWLWIRPGQVHQFEAGLGASAGTVVIWMPGFIDSPAIAALRAAPPYDQRPLRPEGRQRAAVELALRHLTDEFDDLASLPLPVHIEVLRSLLSALVLRLAHGGEGLPTDATAADGGYATFVRFHQAVERDFARTRRVEDYARALGYSVRTLTRACLAATGHPAKEYIDARVVLEAKRQLVHTSTPVLAIAADLGFRDASDFTKFFRRRDPDGRTPAEFRAIAGGRARGGR
ncbi:helix-turn-helix transcriptional regulator [Phaeacidiphilus oryzae]|uniref:helix-turn-helix transcriptional regulator n=1 Tax=Phaeacidiphilus oryzae TaxID=348818 RepID=UPI00068B5BE5|nr:AraC family transcriptional regulator [Phaeacidiphilus oryzae]